MELDKAGFCVRFVFGLLAGMAFGGQLFWSLGIRAHSLSTTLALFAVPALLSAFLAVRFGDRFFR